MLISVKYNFVFLCTPKNASTSIEAVLNSYSDIALLGLPAFRHTNFMEYSQHIKPYMKEKAGIGNLETTCLIREPLSWLNSWYRFRSRYELRNPEHPNHKNSTYGIPFPEFVEAYMSPNPPSYANVGSQFRFVKDNTNNIGVDKIFLYENIDDFVDYMSQKVGKKLILGNKNMSPNKLYTSDIASWANQIYNKISNRMNIIPLSSESNVKYELSEDLTNSIRRFIPEDFELYEMVKNSHNNI